MATMRTLTLRSGDLKFTSYVSGKKDAPLIICLHGFPDSARSFRFQLPFFASSGYRVLAPMLRGFEPQSQPSDGDYSIAALAGDVITWIEASGADKIHLVGHDWGAVIGYAVGSAVPERLHSLTTIAVPHPGRFTEVIKKIPKQILNSWYMNFFQLRGIAELSVSFNDWALIRKLWRDWSPGYTLPADEWDALRTIMSASGVKRAMLGYYRHNASPRVMLGLKQGAGTNLMPVNVPSLLITGADDGCLDTRSYEIACTPDLFPKGRRIERIEDAGHFVHIEKPELINKTILAFLEQNKNR